MKQQCNCFIRYYEQVSNTIARDESANCGMVNIRNYANADSPTSSVCVRVTVTFTHTHTHTSDIPEHIPGVHARRSH